MRYSEVKLDYLKYFGILPSSVIYMYIYIYLLFIVLNMKLSYSNST